MDRLKCPNLNSERLIHLKKTKKLGSKIYKLEYTLFIFFIKCRSKNIYEFVFN